MSRGINIQKQLFLIVALACAVLFAPTTMIVFFGMMPTIGANLMDKTRSKSRAMCVGMMNLAGVMPFVLELWLSSSPNSLENAIKIMMEPKSVIIMYVMAATGYAIESTVTGMVATIMQQRATARLKQIDLILNEMQDRWGYFVDGSTKLDDYGFPVKSNDE
ncbi:MAG: hypothetical protein EBQ96_03660 [Proteobacteria bacterium]|nr:hypothetical protein [Pseudomonadota bacterium]